jgi:excisionase family DNA binding protein
MTQQEAADRLRVSKPTYYRLLRAGKLHPRRISPGKVLVLRAEVDALLA